MAEPGVRSLAATGLGALRAQLGASSWLMAGTLSSGVLAYVSVSVSARVLGTSDFGLLGALLGAGSFATFLLRPLSFAATPLAAALYARAGGTAIRGLAGLAIALGGALAGVLLVVLAGVSTPLGAVLQTTNLWPIVLLGPLIAGLACVQLTTGILAGAHKFTWLAATLVVEAAARALLTGPLVVLLGVSGSVAAYILGQVAAVVFSTACLGGPAWRPPPARELVSGVRVGTSAALLLAAVGLLQQGDLLLLRWYGRPEDAGLYAACASIGNLFVTLAAPLYVPAFPRAFAAHREARPTLPILLGVLAPMLAAGAFTSVAAIWLGGPIARLLFGAAFEGSGSIVPAYIAKTTMLVVCGMVGQHALATGRRAAVHLAFVPALVGLVALGLLRPEPVGAAMLMLVAGAALAAWVGLMAWAGHSDV